MGAITVEDPTLERGKTVQLVDPAAMKDEPVCHLDHPNREEKGHSLCGLPVDGNTCAAMDEMHPFDLFMLLSHLRENPLWWRCGRCIACGGPLCKRCLRLAALWEDHGIWEGHGPRPRKRWSE